MKNLLTSDKLRKKYNPQIIYRDIRKIYQKNLKKLQLSLGSKNSPLLKYNHSLQISFLDSKKRNIDELVNEIASTLIDTVYFMLLPKKKRTSVSRNMRSYLRAVAENQIERLKLVLDDSEIGLIKEFDDCGSKHKSMELVYSILKTLITNFELELKRWDNLPRIGYLTGLQVSMIDFFQKLKRIGMTQKDQITLVKNLFDDFEVDWSVADRENIKISIQQPAGYFYKINNKYKRDFIDPSFSKTLSKDFISDFIRHAIAMQKSFRRF